MNMLASRTPAKAGMQERSAAGLPNSDAQMCWSMSTG